MHITLINPPALVGKYAYSAFSHPPLGLGYIAACLRQEGHAVQVIDAVGEAIARFATYLPNRNFLLQGLSADGILAAISPETGLIGFSCMFTHAWPATRGLIHKTNRLFPKIPLVAGGEHPTALPALCLKQAPLTACVLGEGEATMVELAKTITANKDLATVSGIATRNDRTGEITTTAPRRPILDLDCLPWPAWDLIPWEKYHLYVGPVSCRTMPMLSTRGCPYHCAFCTAAAMWGGIWRKRSPAGITRELRHNIRRYGIQEFQFFDISSLIDRRWVKALCRQILKERLDIKWNMPVGNRSEVIDKDTARLLVRSGCDYIQFAPESGSPRVLKKMNKKMDLDHLLLAIKAATDAGMRVCALFIIGYPGETMADIRLTYHLIRRLARSEVREIAISSFALLPGTPIFHELRQRQTITLNDDFFYQAAGATAFGLSHSWNPPFGRRRLMVLKWLGLIQFYGLSFLYHPHRPLNLLRNLRRGRQETKMDRVLREISEKIKRRFSTLPFRRHG